MNPKEAQDKFKEMNEAYQVLSDAELRQRYNMFLGVQQEPTYSEDSLYAQLLRKRDLRMAQEMRETPARPFDLDEELRKLAEIKAMREREMKNKRDENLKRKTDELNKIFFKRELRSMKDQQFLSKDKYSYYNNETVRAAENEYKQ